jgi:hypothetical protein
MRSQPNLFLNVSGACNPRPPVPAVPEGVLDTDPDNQIMLSERLEWSEHVERWCAAGFTTATTYENTTPTARSNGRLAWKTTRMPVVRELGVSRRHRAPADAPWTTVMTWNAFKGVGLQGR